MELDEFHVGGAAAGTPGGGNAVTGGGVGVGGVKVDLARAAGGQNGVRRAEGDDLVRAFVERVQAQAARRLVRGLEFVAGDQVHQRVLLEQADVGGLPDALNQGALHGGPGGVRHVHDAAGAVAALAGQVQDTVFFRKRHAQPLQPGDGVGRVFHHFLGGGQVTQAGASHQCVVHMGRKGVAFFQHGCNAALRPAAGAVGHGAFGQDGHAVGGGQVQRGGQSGQAAANDQNIKGVGHGSAWKGPTVGG